MKLLSLLFLLLRAQNSDFVDRQTDRDLGEKSISHFPHV